MTQLCDGLENEPHGVQFARPLDCRHRYSWKFPIEGDSSATFQEVTPASPSAKPQALEGIEPEIAWGVIELRDIDVGGSEVCAAPHLLGGRFETECGKVLIHEPVRSAVKCHSNRIDMDGTFARSFA